MKNRKIKKRLLSFLFIITIFASIGIVANADWKDNADVISGERVIVNMDDYCNPGAAGPEKSMASPSYNYTFHNGHTANIHMGYVTADYYSLGEPRHGSDGNTIWAYCMEFDVEAYAAADRYGAAAESAGGNRAWSRMSEAQRKGVMLATLYGFPKVQNGPAAADSYAATQILIWEFQTGVRNSVTNNARQAVNYSYSYGGESGTVSLPQNFFYNIIAVSPGGINAYNNLVAKIYNHEKQPSFASSRIELAYDSASGKYTKTLTDTNGVLSTYDITADSGVTASVSGNTLTLTANRYVNGANLTLTKKAQPATSQSMLVLSATPEGQTMVTGQRQVPVSYTYKVYALNGSIKVQKRSSDGVVSGIKFNVTGQGINTVLTTDSSGVAVLNNIPVGSYTVTEQVPDRYVNQAPKTVTVQSGQTVVAAFGNVVKKGDLIIRKIDAGTGKAVPGAQFEVYDENDNHVATEVANENGEAVFKDLLYGNYYVFESLAPAGYLLSEKRYDFSITEEGQVIEETFEDENLMRRFSLYKKGEVLTGFTESKDGDRTVFKPEYEEQYLSGCVVGIFAGEDIYTSDGTRRFQKDELVDSVVTNKEGPVFTKDLFEGVYYAKEIGAPKGYALNEKTTEVCLFSDDCEVTLENDRIKANLIFTKTMADTMPELLPTLYKQVVFGVFAGEDIEGLPAGSLLEIIRLGEDGSCRMTADLPYGFKYYIRELETAAGYVKDEKEYAFDFAPAASDPVSEIEICENNEIINRPDESKRAIERAYYGPDTADELSANAKLLIITAAESIVLTVLIIIKKNKLTLYY
ncbi:MAG: Cys-Gln thioester bond-forming surface protein [Clostridia bacterium]|nr:Cys-Gln thioester bond-forming surface protein [Clostridia bacterium]MBQ3897922.1 Cys-Gln thioester bond-forming surface protein [Clostridia bacterium]